MKDAIIIAVCTILLGGIGFGAGYSTAKVDEAPPMSAVEQAKFDKLPQAAKDEAEKNKPKGTDVKMGAGEKFGIIGAVAGLVIGAGANFAMGKKK